MAIMKELLIVLTILAVAHARASSSFGGIDIEQYKSDKTHLDGLYKCLVGKGACRPNESKFKARGHYIVRSFCDDCSRREEKLVRDLLSLIGNDNPDHLHDVLNSFDSESRSTRSFLLYLRSVPSLARIPFLNAKVVNEFRDDANLRQRVDQFVDDGGLLGVVSDVVGDLLRDLVGKD